MQYITWGLEYLSEAQALKQYVDILKRQLARADSATAKDLGRRISLIYSMYLECLHIGRELVQRGLMRGEPEPPAPLGCVLLPMVVTKGEAYAKQTAAAAG